MLPAQCQVIRAQALDAAALAALHAQALPPGWPPADFAASCANANRAVLKAMSGTDLLGLAVLQFAADEAEILSVAVAKEARRLGAGSAIMKACVAACEQRLISYIYLEVAEGNQAALKLYEKFGFSVIASRKNYYHAGRTSAITALIMKREIGRGLSPIDYNISRT